MTGFRLESWPSKAHFRSSVRIYRLKCKIRVWRSNMPPKFRVKHKFGGGKRSRKAQLKNSRFCIGKRRHSEGLLMCFLAWSFRCVLVDLHCEGIDNFVTTIFKHNTQCTCALRDDEEFNYMNCRVCSEYIVRDCRTDGTMGLTETGGRRETG